MEANVERLARDRPFGERPVLLARRESKARLCGKSEAPSGRGRGAWPRMLPLSARRRRLRSSDPGAAQRRLARGLFRSPSSRPAIKANLKKMLRRHGRTDFGALAPKTNGNLTAEPSFFTPEATGSHS